jgi:hypothetical protein
MTQMKQNKLNLEIQKKSDSYTEFRSCPLCNKDLSQSVLTFNNFQFFTDSNSHPKVTDIDIHQCNNCGTLYNNPIYTDEGFLNLFSEAGQSYGMTEGRCDEQIEYLNKHNILQNSNSVLDLGCYEGKFLTYFPQSIKKAGIDIDLPSLKIAKKKLPDIDFYCQDLEKFNTGEKYDLIVMFHVLEHLKNPLDTLKNILNSSHKETRLIIEVPILENGFTNDINGFFSSQHLTHFSRDSLKLFFELSGWKILRFDEQKDYNGTRVVAQPNPEFSENNNPRFDVDKENLYKYFQHWYKTVESVEKSLLKISNNDKYIIWGAGLHTEFLFNKTSFFHNNRDAQFIFFDSDELKIGKKYKNIDIVKPFNINMDDWDDAPIIISSYGNTEEMKSLCIDQDIPEEKIITFYDKFYLY